MSDSAGLSDQGKLLFGAGFVFGVTATLLIFGIVLVAVRDAAGVVALPSTVLATMSGGVVFATVVGAGLYYLAFPENRTNVAVDPALFGLDDDDEEA